MQAGAPYVPPDCQTYPGGQKRVLIKKTALKRILSAHFFEQISLPAALSVVERQLFCRCITNTTQPHISLYEKNPRCSSLCFRLQCQRLRSGSRRSGGVPRPRCPEVLQERQKVPQEMCQGRQMPRKMRPALQQRGTGCFKLIPTCPGSASKPGTVPTGIWSSIPHPISIPRRI